jgi:hypothetical protein
VYEDMLDIVLGHGTLGGRYSEAKDKRKEKELSKHLKRPKFFKDRAAKKIK